MIFIGKTAEDFENKWKEISLTERPIVVWGATEIAQMALAALDTLENKIIAVGDNNIAKQGKAFCGYKICSSDEIIQRYPNAIIIVSVLLERTARMIINQLSEKNPEFDFCYPCLVEYIFETKILNRDLSEKRYIARAAYNRVDDENNIIISKHDPGVLKYYNYYDYDSSNQLDLYNEIARISRLVPAIKRLDIHINSENMDVQKAELIKKVAKLDNILHIYLLIDDNCRFDSKSLNVVCDVICGIKIITDNPQSWLIQAIEDRKINAEIYNPLANQDKPKHFELCNDAVTVRIILKEIEAETGVHSSYIESDSDVLDMPISIVWIGGGLGNQIATYLFVKKLENESGMNVIIDDISPTVHFLNNRSGDLNKMMSQFYRENSLVSNTDKLEDIVKKTSTVSALYYQNTEIFDVSNAYHNCLSQFYSQDQWLSICFKFRMNELSLLSILSKKYRYSTFNDNRLYSPNIETMNLYKIEDYNNNNDDNLDSLLTTSLDYNKFYFGLFSSIGNSDWLIKESCWCRNQIQLNKLLPDDEINCEYLNEINSSISVGIHIRRGDFVSFGLGFENETIFRGYFINALTNIRRLIKSGELKFFIFSDEPDWCMTNAEMFGIDVLHDDIVFISHNGKENSYKDMILLSNCKYIVPYKGSTFSYCAIALSSSCEYYADPDLYVRYKNSNIPDENINCILKKNDNH